MGLVKATFSTYHRAEIEIPEAFYRKHGLTSEYNLASVRIASAAMVHSGQDSYGTVIEWAEDSDRAALEQWVRSLDVLEDLLRRRTNERR